MSSSWMCTDDGEEDLGDKELLSEDEGTGLEGLSDEDDELGEWKG